MASHVLNRLQVEILSSLDYNGEYHYHAEDGGIDMDKLFKLFKKEKELTREEQARVCYRDGKMFLDQHEYEKAISSFEQSVALDAANADAHDYLGRSYAEKGMSEAALKELKNALDLDPDRWETHYYMGVAHGKMGNYEEAIKEHEHELSLNPRYGAAHGNLAVAYFKVKNFKLAIQHHDKARDMGCHIDPDFQETIEKIRNTL